MTDSAKLRSMSTNQNPPAPSNGGGGSDLGGHIAKLEARMDYLATKEDVAKLEAEMKHFATKEDVGKLEARMEHLATKEDIQSVRTDMQSIRTDMQSMFNKLILWAVATAFAIISAMGVLLRYFN